jgi:hypothetical protein
MTKLRQRDDYRNAYMDWIRSKVELDSGDGYRVYDVDSVIWKTDSKRWLIIESKGGGATIDKMRPHQRHTLEVLHRSLAMNKEIDFRGTWVVTFQNTNPADGWTVIAKFDGETWTRYYSPRHRLNEKEFILFLVFCLTGRK